MKMLTLRLKPKTIFGLILIAAGIIVICITFYSNHVNSVSNTVMLETDSAREQYLTSLAGNLKPRAKKKKCKFRSSLTIHILNITKFKSSRALILKNIRGKAPRSIPII